MDIGYVNSWNINDRKDVHPYRRTAVVEIDDIIIEILKLKRHDLSTNKRIQKLVDELKIN